MDAPPEKRAGYVRAVYLIDSYLPLADAAAILAGEQSTGTFVQVPGETPELRRRHGAVVRRILNEEASSRNALPGALRLGSSELRSGVVEIDFPLENFGVSLPNLMATVMGNLFELRELAGVRLLDLQLPEDFTTRYPGPQFGPKGTRQLIGRPDGPILGTIVKPSVGLSPEDLASLVRQLIDAGLDFVKDDELLGNPPYLPLAQRVDVVMREVERGADRHGRKLMYAFNISDDIGNLVRNHDLVAAAGGTCVMVCINTVGLAGVAYLREHSELPIHGHRAMIGALTRCPNLGVDFVAYQKLARLAGVDQLHVGGLSSKFFQGDEEVVRSVKATLEPLLGGYAVVPVLSSGQSPMTVPITYTTFQTTELMMLAGGGILAHPLGIEAGVTAMRQAWDATLCGESLVERAKSCDELASALSVFGSRLDTGN